MLSRCDADEKEIFKVPEKRDRGWSGASEQVSHVREEVLKNEVIIRSLLYLVGKHEISILRLLYKFRSGIHGLG